MYMYISVYTDIYIYVYVYTDIYIYIYNVHAAACAHPCTAVEVGVQRHGEVQLCRCME